MFSSHRNYSLTTVKSLSDAQNCLREQPVIINYNPYIVLAAIMAKTSPRIKWSSVREKKKDQVINTAIYLITKNPINSRHTSRQRQRRRRRRRELAHPETNQETGGPGGGMTQTHPTNQPTNQRAAVRGEEEREVLPWRAPGRGWTGGACAGTRTLRSTPPPPPAHPLPAAAARRCCCPSSRLPAAGGAVSVMRCGCRTCPPSSWLGSC